MVAVTRFLWRGALGGMLGLFLGILVLPIKSGLAPPNTKDFGYRIIFAVVCLPVAVMIGTIIGATTGLLERKTKYGSGMIMRTIIGIIIGGVLGAIFSSISNSHDATIGVLTFDRFLFTKYGLIVGAAAGIMVGIRNKPPD